MRNTFITVILMFSTFSMFSCKTTDQTGRSNPEVIEKLVSNINSNGVKFEFSFMKGESFNHPTFAFWIEDTLGNFIQTLFVTKSFGSGTFKYGNTSGGKWNPGQISRPAALPYWSHKIGPVKGLVRFIPDSINTIPDAYTGATPNGSFLLQTKSDSENHNKVKVFFEINQTWDWNEYWTNNKFPDDTEYKTSCQPAVVYSATVDLNIKESVTQLSLIGRSSHSGADGKLYYDLHTLTTALKIVEKISVIVK